MSCRDWNWIGLVIWIVGAVLVGWGEPGKGVDAVVWIGNGTVAFESDLQVGGVAIGASIKDLKQRMEERRDWIGVQNVSREFSVLEEEVEGLKRTLNTVQDECYKNWYLRFKVSNLSTSVYPSKRRMAIIHLVHEDLALLWGGNVEQTDLNLYNFTTASWMTVAGENAPAPRKSSYSVVYRDWMYVANGNDNGGHSTNSTFRLNIHSWKWEEFPTRNQPYQSVGGHGLLDTNQMAIALGENQAGDFVNKTWFLDLDKAIWKEIDTLHFPPGRKLCASVVRSNQLYIQGGAFSGGFLNDFWRFEKDSSSSWNWIQISLTAVAHAGHRMVLYGGRHFMLFGGFKGDASGHTNIFQITEKNNEWKQFEIEDVLPEVVGSEPTVFVRNRSIYFRGSTQFFYRMD